MAKSPLRRTKQTSWIQTHCKFHQNYKCFLGKRARLLQRKKKHNFCTIFPRSKIAFFFVNVTLISGENCAEPKVKGSSASVACPGSNTVRSGSNASISSANATASAALMTTEAASISSNPEKQEKTDKERWNPSHHPSPWPLLSKSLVSSSAT